MSGRFRMCLAIVLRTPWLTGAAFAGSPAIRDQTQRYLDATTRHDLCARDDAGLQAAPPRSVETLRRDRRRETVGGKRIDADHRPASVASAGRSVGRAHDLGDGERRAAGFFRDVPILFLEHLADGGVDVVLEGGGARNPAVGAARAVLVVDIEQDEARILHLRLLLRTQHGR